VVLQHIFCCPTIILTCLSLKNIPKYSELQVTDGTRLSGYVELVVTFVPAAVLYGAEPAGLVSEDSAGKSISITLYKFSESWKLTDGRAAFCDATAHTWLMPVRVETLAFRVCFS
jgi:hypothetical protein